ncbi:MAG: glutamate synthase large subunit [Candidatus Omnitrophica bacterium]|nr:glutamate synthase large subunit [Candidatus Omnitrophota bacterium]
MYKFRPQQTGLYDPRNERDACGVGFIANMKGVKSHDIVQKGIRILVNLAHRGACGCDPLTGDGAGLLIQIPHEFFARETEKLGFGLPKPGQYGVGMVFMPRDLEERNQCKLIFETIAREEGLAVLGWRDAPRDNTHIGWVAREAEPVIRQIFLGAGPDIKDTNQLQRKLYVVRKCVENAVRKQGLREEKFFYVPSLSARTVVYKGQLIAWQLEKYFLDLHDNSMVSALAMVHSRYSTNTFPSWDLAHPYRFICHNGEINTLRGNINWMRTRQALMASELFGKDMKKLFPIINEKGSDSAIFDNALELLVMGGRSLRHAIMMMIPEAWTGDEFMSREKKDFYEYHSCSMEPWDGPASIAFSDGREIGAVLDRNGLRPSRYTVTKDGFVIMASETGVLDIDPANVLHKDRLTPGRMFLVSLEEGRIIADEEIKHQLAARRPYGKWLKENLVHLENVPNPRFVHGFDKESLKKRQAAFGYTVEDLRIIIAPMAIGAQEPVGSMGNDTPLACLSDKAPLLFNYFKQLFAQVTNPPIDPIREELVMSTELTIGQEQNLLDETPEHCHQLKLKHPVISNEELEKIRNVAEGKLQSATIPILFNVDSGPDELERAMKKLCEAASKAVEEGNTILILSDRGVDEKHAPIPSLLAVAGVHHHLIREGTRSKVGIVIETGEAREMHHFALLIGYGAGAVNPYLCFETIIHLVRHPEVPGIMPTDLDEKDAVKNFIKATRKGLLKIISKMGISTIQSYRGAQIFEAVGLNDEVIGRYFTHTASRVGGVGLDVIGKEALIRHERAFPKRETTDKLELDVGGQYQWRQRGEYHMWNPATIALFQHAVRSGKYELFKKFSETANSYDKKFCTLRGLLEFKWAEKPVPIEEVEPVSEIVKRFNTGAMSFGSISKEAHENLAIAMNRLGGKSNTGEGGEDPARYIPDANGDLRRSRIKQVASGRFGVDSYYLVHADELQIKMAQGAKPGEGGQLPGHKVSQEIGRVRYTTPGVQLISPAPHHDIYSIEDLAQLIFDLKNGNDQANINVKLVAEVGVGTIAAGVSKGHAELVLISGDTGGTGASPQTSIKHAGLPWELGVAETHQTLVLNDLRGRIIVQTDGQIKTGRDVAMAVLLGAEQWGVATGSLIASGCIMMRKCHLNTCPVGVATQDPELRKKFSGKPDYVVNLFFFIAEELREIMARLGFRTVNEMIGRVDKLEVKKAIDHWKAKGLDFSKILHKPDVPPHIATHCVQKQDHGLSKAIDHELVKDCAKAIERKEKVRFERPIRNANRAVGAILSSRISRKYGYEGLPQDTIHIKFSGSAGQSFGCWLAPGITLELEGDANDYLGKGLSGGKLIAYPPRNASYVPEENIIIGNVCFYGATRGEAYIRGMAGERFCVRNSGVHAVVEAVGDHGCEYMTGGYVVVLGPTGRNFAAGMSGGIAYVLDEKGNFPKLCNQAMVDLEKPDEKDIERIAGMIGKHIEYTQSKLAAEILKRWGDLASKFVKVYPKDYKRALTDRAKQDGEVQLASAAVLSKSA